MGCLVAFNGETLITARPPLLCLGAWVGGVHGGTYPTLHSGTILTDAKFRSALRLLLCLLHGSTLDRFGDDALSWWASNGPSWRMAQHGARPLLTRRSSAPSLARCSSLSRGLGRTASGARITSPTSRGLKTDVLRGMRPVFGSSRYVKKSRQRYYCRIWCYALCGERHSRHVYEDCSGLRFRAGAPRDVRPVRFGRFAWASARTLHFRPACFVRSQPSPPERRREEGQSLGALRCKAMAPRCLSGLAQFSLDCDYLPFTTKLKRTLLRYLNKS